MSEDKYITVFTEIARGDAGAFDLLVTLLKWFHVHDDMLDGERSKYPLAEISVMMLLDLMDMLSSNPFWQKHRSALRSVVRISAISYLDSERLKKSDNLQDKLCAEVLKSEYQNIFWAVADCVGGFEHARAMSAKHRAYYFG